MRRLFNAALALAALKVLNALFEPVPPHAQARIAEVERVRELERQKSLSWSAKIRAADRAMNHGLEDWAAIEAGYEWDVPAEWEAL